MTPEEKLIHKRLRKLLVQSTPYTFRSYKPMCETLKLPIKEGNSRVCQVKWLQNLCNLEKIPNSRSYTFSTVYQDPDAHVLESNPIALAAADILLHSFIGQTEKPPTLTLDLLSIWKLLGFVNNDYNSTFVENDFVKTSDISKEVFQYFKLRCKERLDHTLKSTLNTLSKRNLIQYEPIKIIFKYSDSNQLTSTVATSEELDRLAMYEQKILSQFYCASIPQVWLKGKEIEFYASLKKYIKEQEHESSWAFVSNGYRIILTDTRWLYSKGKKEINVEDHRRTINEHFIEVLAKNAETQYLNYQDKREERLGSLKFNSEEYAKRFIAVFDRKGRVMESDYLRTQHLLTDRFINLRTYDFIASNG